MMPVSNFLLPTWFLITCLNVSIAPVVASAFAILLSSHRTWSLPTRHALLVVGLAAGVLAPLISPLFRLPSVWTIDVSAAQSPPIAANLPTVATRALLEAPEPSATPFAPAPVMRTEVHQTQFVEPVVDAQPTWERIAGTWLCGIWFVGIGIGIVRSVRGVVRLRRWMQTLAVSENSFVAAAIQSAVNDSLADSRRESVEGHQHESVPEQAQHKSIRTLRSWRERATLRNVEVFESDHLSTPVAFGLIRPRIVVPTGIESEISQVQLRAIMRHELAHIARRDLWIGLLQQIASVCYWWNPLVHLANHQLAQFREQICDDIATRELEDPGTYAVTLVSIAERTSKYFAIPATLGIGFSPARQLENRVRRLLSSNRNAQIRLSRNAAAAAMCTAIVLTGTILVAQVQPEAVPAEPQSAKSMKTAPAQKEDKSQQTTTIVVTDYRGKPLKQGTVRLSGDTWTGAYFDSTTAIQDGIATVPLKSDQVDQMTFKITSPGYMTFLRKYNRAAEDRFLLVAQKYTFELKPGITIGGTVVSEAGTPVTNAYVYAYCPPTGVIEDGIHAFEQQVTTNHDGNWKMLGAPEDLDCLTLRISDGTSRTEAIPFIDPFPLIAILPPDHAKLKAQADVRTLAVPPTSRGMVVDPTGKPVSGALVLFAGRNFYRDHGANLIPKTDVDGSFSLPTPTSGSEILTVYSPHWALQTVKVTFPLIAPLKIVMQKGRRVAFRTLNSEGHAVSGIRFYPEPPRVAPFDGNNGTNFLYVLDYLGHRDLLKNTSDNNGNFVWENAPSETLGYQITSSKYLSQPGGEFGPTNSAHILHFRPIIPLEITIVDDVTGEPIPEYKVYLGTHFKQNPAGHWSWNFERPLKAHPPGRYTNAVRCLDRIIQYRIEADGYQPGVTPAYDAKELPDSPILVDIRLKKSEK